MASTTTVLLLAAWLLAVGLVAVCLEVRAVQCGLDVRLLLRDEEARVERQRLLELHYNRLLNPDRLEREYREDLQYAEAQLDEEKERAGSSALSSARPNL